MAPILFIYIMMAATDTLRYQIEEEKPKFQYFPNNKNRGQFIRQTTNSKGEILCMDNLLYINDGGFLTELREEAKATAKRSIHTLLVLDSKCTWDLAESWSITQKILKKLQSFHHSLIRRILGIRMDEVQECHITNELVRHWFNNILPIKDFIARRTWRYIGKAY